MGSMQLQPRPLYGIGTVARLTGVKPDTLRIWERRYQLGASHKSPSGRRQYTQSDLEHLQLVAALVAGGTRIGEIASSDRRTLEMLLRVNRKTPPNGMPTAKPRVLFVGAGLSAWLEEHQGCLSSVDALLAPCSVDEFLASDDPRAGTFEEIVVECSALGATTLDDLDALLASTGCEKLLVLYGGSNGRGRALLEEKGFRVGEFPPEPSYLSFHFNRSAVERDVEQGTRNLGDLVEVKDRMYSEGDLALARAMDSGPNCGCPTHLADLVAALSDFEDYSAQCSVENWEDASLHACVYAYAGQARWLIEKALGLVLDAHGAHGPKGVVRPAD